VSASGKLNTTTSLRLIFLKPGNLKKLLSEFGNILDPGMSLLIQTYFPAGMLFSMEADGTVISSIPKLYIKFASSIPNPIQRDPISNLFHFTLTIVDCKAFIFKILNIIMMA
jgi:hypothetical protein